MARKRILVTALVLSFCMLVSLASKGYCKSSEYEVVGIRFFEAGDDPPAEAQRIFSSSFPRSSIRYIWTQIDIKNLLYNVREHNHKVVWQYYTSDGKLWGQVDAEFPVQTSWYTAYHQHGWGWSAPGNWDAGNYTVHVLIDGEKVAEGQFSVYQDTQGGTTSSTSESLYDAAAKGDVAALNAAISRGESVNQANTFGMLPLEGAARNGHLEAVRVLLDKGANINAQDAIFGFSALMSAASGNYVDVIKLLLEKGADINAKSRIGDFTALIYAADAGKAEAVKVLLENGADANVKSTDGVTALIFATQKGHKDTVKALLDNGADISIKDNKSRTALAWATFEKQNEIAKLLKSAEAVRLANSYKGKWTSPEGFLYTYNMKIGLDSEKNVKGEINWTLEISPRPDEQSKIGLTAIELVKGTYDPNTRVLYMEGYDKKDPKIVIGLDKYKLNLSLDGKTLSGPTWNHGTWQGKFYGNRTGIIDFFKK